MPGIKGKRRQAAALQIMKHMKTFLNPPRDFSVMPFWFWNDGLEAGEIRRQIGDFQAHGVHGFVIHPRVGLPRDQGWMSPKLLDFYEVAIEEAAQHGMKVLLYDEGMYPSGSSSGQVVAENPAYACRCLARIDLPDGGLPTLGPDDHLVAIVARQNGTRMAVIDRKVSSIIRGLHYIGEGPDEETPPAADLLNPDAMACFVRLVYDTFAARFSKHFGKTVFAIFTDEPGLLGRCRERDVMPGTTGILAHVNRILGYDFTPHLPALWHDDEPDAAKQRVAYNHALGVRLEDTYYNRLYQWCERHGIPLAGHPAGGDEIGPLRYFHIPGQDLVWRWVMPDQPTALEGPESTQAKCSSSAALHGSRRRNGNECCGAYGHELTFDEMRWLAHWCFVRGVNLLYPHAFYYSIRGPRWDERPPDVGPNNAWWGRYPEYADACRRLSWLNTDAEQVCEVAILCKTSGLPWLPAKACFRHQRDFNYLEERDLIERARVDAEGVHIAGMTYRALIVSHEPDLAVVKALAPLERAGRLILWAPDMAEADLIDRVDKVCEPDVRVQPQQPALRVRHVRKEGLDWFMLFNEESAPIRFTPEFSIKGTGSVVDPVTGRAVPWHAGQPLELAGYELKVMVATGRGRPAPVPRML
jgi:hypothetical protein